MTEQPDHNHYVRRVVLPSGRAIEVVYFDPSAAATETTIESSPTTEEELHLCPECESGLVYPVEWEETSHSSWKVELRCPSCEYFHVGTYAQGIVDRFDDELDRGTAALVRDLRRLTQANMESEIDRFRDALDADAIWPMDF